MTYLFDIFLVVGAVITLVFTIDHYWNQWRGSK